MVNRVEPWLAIPFGFSASHLLRDIGVLSSEGMDIIHRLH
jgi:hypothetical protein